jgi:hypothetical protein
MNSRLTWENVVPERGVEPLCPFGQTGLSRPRIPFRHPGPGHDQHGRRPPWARIILPQPIALASRSATPSSQRASG